MNEPSQQLWKKLNEVSNKLQQVTEQLVEANAINRGYHIALDQMRLKVETLEQQNYKTQGAINLVKGVSAFIFAIAMGIGGWSANSIVQLRQDVAIMQNNHNQQRDNK